MASATDNFNRADGGIGANWTNSLGTLVIVSNAVTAGSAGDRAAWRSAESFDADHSSQVTFTADNDGGGPSVRNQASGANFYAFLYDSFGNGSIYEVNAGVFTQLGAGYSMGTMGVGQFLKLTATGSTLTPNQNGTDFATRTDATHTGGAPGIEVFNTSVRWDDWIGDPISVVASNVPYNPWPQLAPLLAQ